MSTICIRASQQQPLASSPRRRRTWQRMWHRSSRPAGSSRVPHGVSTTRFRLQAAASRRTQLAVVDTSLWAITFANGEAREECRHCHTLDHESAECNQEVTLEAKGKEPASKRRKTSNEEEAKLHCYDFREGRCRRGVQC